MLIPLVMMMNAMMAAGEAAGEPRPCFVDVAAQAGLTTMQYAGGADKDHLLESVGCGCAFIDYDRDGKLDIFLVNAWALDKNASGERVPRIKGSNALYHNLGDGRFENVTVAAGLTSDDWGCGVCAGDYDGDGWVDLYITNFGPNRLFRNRGDGTFEDVTSRAGVSDPGWSTGAAFFDADGDGDLDLYVANYVQATMDQVLTARRTNSWRNVVPTMTGPFGMRGGRDHFYRNNGDGTFTDGTDDAGLTDTAEGYGLGVIASDLDNDGDIDLYIANDSNPNYLYRNDGQGHFTEIGSWCGAGYSIDGAAQAGMGVDAADYDGDSLLDLFVANFIRDYSTLYHNLGGLYFQDVSRSHDIAKATRPMMSWGCAFLDYDLDGDVDLAVINGHIYPQIEQYPELEESYRQHPLLFENDKGKFRDVTARAGAGFQSLISGRGLAVGDYDNDGDLDLLVTAMDSPPLLLRNDSSRRGHWLMVRAIDAKGAPAIGARATITVGGKTQLREVRSGSSYSSQHSMDLHFGVGEPTMIDILDIRWPNGTHTIQQNVKADQVVTVRFGEPHDVPAAPR